MAAGEDPLKAFRDAAAAAEAGALATKSMTAQVRAVFKHSLLFSWSHSLVFEIVSGCLLELSVFNLDFRVTVFLTNSDVY